LYAVGVLVIALAMLKGVFHMAVAVIGIVCGVVGIVCESLRPVMGSWYGIYGILMLWLLAVAGKLHRLSTRGGAEATPQLAAELEVHSDGATCPWQRSPPVRHAREQRVQPHTIANRTAGDHHGRAACDRAEESSA
jgi:hypothetical protein